MSRFLFLSLTLHTLAIFLLLNARLQRYSPTPLSAVAVYFAEEEAQEKRDKRNAGSKIKGNQGSGKNAANAKPANSPFQWRAQPYAWEAKGAGKKTSPEENLRENDRQFNRKAKIYQVINNSLVVADDLKASGDEGVTKVQIRVSRAGKASLLQVLSSESRNLENWVVDSLEEAFEKKQFPGGAKDLMLQAEILVATRAEVPNDPIRENTLHFVRGLKSTFRAVQLESKSPNPLFYQLRPPSAEIRFDPVTIFKNIFMARTEAKKRKERSELERELREARRRRRAQEMNPE